MDIASALTLVSQAIGVVKDLREIDKGFDVAALKAQMADLYGTLADVKMALSDARTTIHERDRKIEELEGRIKILTAGENCPLCKDGTLKIVASRPHPHFGVFGAQERTLRCSTCGHEERRHHDPS